jgi:hypothetical protein
MAEIEAPRDGEGMLISHREPAETITERLIRRTMEMRERGHLSSGCAEALVNAVIRSAGLDPDGPLVPMGPPDRGAAYCEELRRQGRDAMLVRAIRFC